MSIRGVVLFLPFSTSVEDGKCIICHDGIEKDSDKRPDAYD